MKFLLQFLVTTTVLVLIQNVIQATGTCTQCTSNHDAMNAGKQPLYLLVLLPHPSDPGSQSPPWSGGPNVVPAIKLAVEHVNNNTDILQDYELRLVIENGGCDIKIEALISFVKSVTYSDLQIVGLIGPGCSASTVVVAPLTANDEIALINLHGAGTPILEDHNKYPYSFGIFGSSRGVVDTMIALMQDREWDDVAVYHDPSRVFYSSTFDALTRTVETINQQSDTKTLKISLSVAVYNNFIPINSLKRSLNRIVFVLAGPQIARNIMCFAYHKKVVFPDIQWIIIERLLYEFQQDVEFELDGHSYICSSDTMTQLALNGSLIIHYRLAPLNTSAPTQNGSGISYEDFEKSYQQKVDDNNSKKENKNRNITISQWGSMYYDSIWAIALALNNANKLKEFNLSTYGKKNENESFGKRQPSQTLILRRELHKLNFSGISGPIHFNNYTGYADRLFDILQIFDGKASRVAYYDGNKIRQTHNGNYIEAHFPKRVELLPLPVTVILIVITALILIITMIFHFLSIYFRKYYSVRASSPKLTQLAYTGCYFLLFAVIIHITMDGFKLEYVTQVVLCHTINATSSCGFTLLFGTICAKTWRLYRIFKHSWKPGKLLSGQVLFVFIISATFIDVAINILWISLDTIKITEKTHGYIEEDKQILLKITKICDSEYFSVWYILLILYNLLFVLGASTLAIITRKIRLSGFQTKSIVMLTYSVMFLMGLGTPIEIILNTDRNVTFILVPIANFLILNAIVILSIVFLFLPPVFPVFVFKYKEHKEALHTKNNNTITSHR